VRIEIEEAAQFKFPVDIKQTPPEQTLLAARGEIIHLPEGNQQ
jgi:hypothetical protein